MAYYVGMWTFGRSIQVDERTEILTLRSWAESMKKKHLSVLGTMLTGRLWEPVLEW